MTCILAFIDNDGVGHMAGDSSGFDPTYHSKLELTTAKIFKKSEFIIGYTTSFRMGQIIQHSFDPPCLQNVGNTDQEMMKYMVVDFVSKLRSCYESNNYINDSKIPKSGNILVIVRGRLYEISSDWSVFNTPSNINAVGSGAFQAIAAFKVFDRYCDMPIEQKMFNTINIVSEQNICVGGRIDYLNTKDLQ